MSGERDSLERLGADLARAQDAALHSWPLPPAEVAEEQGRHLGRWIGAGAGLAALAVALVAGWGSRTLSVEIDGSTASDPSAWISVAPASETPMRFSDGSTLLLVGGSHARVVSLTPRGAHLQLDRGRAVVSVIHRDAARWQLDVGPFTVDVTGTRFEVAWDAAAHAFSLSMQEGSVHVHGPGLADKVLVAGQSLVQRVGEDPPPPIPVPLAPPAHPAPASAEVDPPTVPPRALEAPRAPAVPSVSAPVARRVAPVPALQVAPAASPDQGFRALYDSGRYAEALLAAKAHGVAGTLAAASAEDLLVLGDTARLAGDPSLSKQALETTRGRYPHTAASARACFLLGRLAFDVDGRPVEAAKWFERYLDEAPAGPLAREALGRLLESLDRAGDHSGAEERARQYLEQYPTGPHAALARSLRAQ